MGFPSSLPRFLSFGIPSTLWWMGIAAGVRSAGAMTVIFLAVYVSEDIGLPLSVAGIVLGCFGIGSILGSILSGRLSDRVGCRTTLVASLVLEGIAFALFLLNHAPLYVAAIVGFIGLFDGAFRPAYNGIMMRICPTSEMRSLSYSWYLVMTNIGYIIAAALGGALSGFSFALLLAANTLTCFLAAALMLHLVPDSANERTVKGTSQGRGLISRQILRNRTFLLVLFSTFATAIVHGQLLSSLPVYLRKALLLDEAVIGWIFALNGLILVTCQMLVTSMLRRVRNTLACAVGSLLLCVPFLALIPQDSLLFLAVFLLLFTLGEMILWPSLTSLVMAISEEQENRGEYIGLYHAVFGVSHIFAAPLGLGLYGMIGSSAVWLMCSLVGLVTAMLFSAAPAKT